MRTKKGIVLSNKNDKTITVVVHSYRTHPKYQKRYGVSKKFYAHDPDNQYKEGDAVEIYETRPLSKTKRWTVIKPDTTNIK
ncbi:30S ribosomal protein S17 [Candidatus Peregrinibacteria bacterium RIFOXYB2_FULL_32_7]|nr:MAG: 30S ribosomal protein S17 [Candidatus Peregrinibacteria bacterium RIFOXYB2_FULL_32_7]